MKSQLFPLLDSGDVTRLLRDGLCIEANEQELLYAASQLARLKIISLNEIQTIRCVNPRDDDFPDEIMDEKCEGVVRLTSRSLSKEDDSGSHLKIEPIELGVNIYQCTSCGRFIEYTSRAKQQFMVWETALRPEGLVTYVKAANLALLEDTTTIRPSSSIELSAHELLTESRSRLRQRISKLGLPSGLHREAGSYRRRLQSYKSDLQRERLKQVHNSLLSAFPSKESLARMLKYELDINLQEIAGGGNLNEIVHEIIVVAESNAWLSDLVHAAQRANQGNEQLAQVDL